MRLQAELGQVPAVLQGGAPVLRDRHEPCRHVQALGHSSHRCGFGLDVGVLEGLRAQAERGRVAVGQRQAPHAALGIADPQPARCGIASGGQAQPVRRGGKFGHDAVHADAGGFQARQVGRQPGPVAHGHPRVGLVFPIGRQGHVQLCGVIEQTLFEQTLQGRFQTGPRLVQAGGQRDPVPGQGAGRHQRHHFGLALACGQQTGAGPVQLQGRWRGFGLDPCVRVGAGGTGVTQGELNDQCAHLLFIVGGACDATPVCAHATTCALAGLRA